MSIEGDQIILSTGRAVYANMGIIGLSDDGNVTGGYDDVIWHREYSDWEDGLTPNERMELAEHMIARWQAFRAAAQASIT